MTRIGIVQPGSTYAEMIERFGDYHAWFERALEPTGATCEVHPWGAAPPPDPAAADAWLVTGARSAVHERGPAVESLLEWIRGVVVEGTPLLGVCYGHQALCAALGSEVERHPGGWELGTTEVRLTEAGRADPLFAGFPERFRVQTTHEDRVTAPPPGATLLATNAHTEVQAVAVGPVARGVQFHPEVTETIAADFAERRAHLLPAPARIEAAPWGGRVLVNFVERIVRGRVPEGA